MLRYRPDHPAWNSSARAQYCRKAVALNREVEFFEIHGFVSIRIATLFPASSGSCVVAIENHCSHLQLMLLQYWQGPLLQVPLLETSPVQTLCGQRAIPRQLNLQSRRTQCAPLPRQPSPSSRHHEL